MDSLFNIAIHLLLLITIPFLGVIKKFKWGALDRGVSYIMLGVWLLIVGLGFYVTI
ncbi:Uncharacterised protein [Listeria newyorkensis]|nr:Uncharacterised protein [Listeria newyorkensis]